MLRKYLCLALALMLALTGTALADESALLEAYDLISPLGNGAYAVRLNGRWGIADESGNALLAPQLSREPEFEGGYAVVSLATASTEPDFFGYPGALWGVIDERGNVCVPFEYESIQLTGGLALARRDSRYVYLDMQGQPINDQSYATAEPFVGNCAVVGIEQAGGGLLGAIDNTGAQVLPFEYAALTLSSDGPATARRAGEGKYGYIDLNGAQVIEAKFDAAGVFHGGLAWVGREIASDDGWGAVYAYGLIDEAGNELLPMEYDNVRVDEGGVAEVRRGESTRWYALRDGALAEVEAPSADADASLIEDTLRQISDANPSSTLGSARPAKGRAGDGELYIERRDGLWYLTDASGKTVLDEALLKEPQFENGLAAACVRTDELIEGFSLERTYEILWGVIDQAGAVRVPFEYDELSLTEGIARAYEDGEYLYLNAADGKPLNSERYYRAEDFRDGYAAVAILVDLGADASFSSSALWGIIDAGGAQVVPFEYEYLEMGDGGAAVVEYETGSGNEYGYIGMDGKPLFDARYDRAQPFVGDYAAVGERIGSARAEDSEPETILWGVIDRAGNPILPREYDEIELREGDICRTRQGETEQWYALRDGQASPIDAPA